MQAMCVAGLGLAISLDWVLKMTDAFRGESLDCLIYPLAFSAALATLVRHKQRHAAIRTQIGRGICPGCDYRIARLPIKADGYVVCPECGASWQVQDEPDRRRDACTTVAHTGRTGARPTE